HVFGSLALLAFYRDWRVLVSASAVVVADHLLRGIYWPQSVYGVLESELWRWLEHAGWVLFEDGFLAISIAQCRKEMWTLGERQAKLEAANTDMLADIAARKQAEEGLRAITAGARCLLWDAFVEEHSGALVWETEFANPDAAREVLQVQQPPEWRLVDAWRASILDEDR